MHTPKAGAAWAGAPNAEDEAKLPNPCRMKRAYEMTRNFDGWRDDHVSNLGWS